MALIMKVMSRDGMREDWMRDALMGGAVGSGLLNRIFGRDGCCGGGTGSGSWSLASSISSGVAFKAGKSLFLNTVVLDETGGPGGFEP